jgi:esterase/lipase superfamily enzyme
MPVRLPTLLLLLSVLGAGCAAGPQLSPAPNLYWATGQNPFGEVPEAFRTPDIELVYATDRRPIESEDDGQAYDHNRSHSLAMGIATVRIGEDLTWDEIVQASTTSQRSRRIPMSVVAIEEIARLPASNTPQIFIDGLPQERPEYVAELEAGEAAFEALLRERLAQTPVNEVFIYVHGYANTFDDAAIRMATLWHYLGRQGVPIAYTWPAGQKGLLQGYNYDRESSEFTIFHLKQLLRVLGRMEEIDRIHIIAHSRGTDVVLSTMRELWIELRSSGGEVKKLSNVIIAAADIDWDVLQQRLTAERMPNLLENWVFYMSEEDKAIGLSTWLFSSLARLGRITADDLSPQQQETLAQADGIQVVDVNVKSGFIGHSYFITNPAVLSDIILVLRDGRRAGAENGRPLERMDGVFWSLDDRYLVDQDHAGGTEARRHEGTE